MRRALGLLVLLAIGLAGVAHAQGAGPGVAIVAPPDRFVAPAGFATLVFRLDASAATSVDVAAEVDLGWSVLRPPGRIDLAAGRSTPVAVTVAVPGDAAAGTRAEVRLVVDDGAGGRGERVVVLTVTERVAVDLQVPAEHTLGGDALEARVRNDGNVEERATVDLLRDGVLLDRATFVLPPGASEAAAFAPVDEGLHLVVLTTERGAEVRRSVRVLRFGAGLDVPFVLAAEVSGAVGTSGRRALAFGVKGAVSDFVAIDALVDAAAWTRSFASVEGPAWSARAGVGWRDPFGLSLPADLGLAGRWQGEAWGVAAHAGWAGDDRFGGTVSVRWSGGATEVAAGAGVRAGSPQVALRAATAPRPGAELVATAGLRAGVVDTALRFDVAEGAAASRFGVEARDLLGTAARVDLGVRHRVAASELYADGTVPIGPTAVWAGRVGFREAPPTPLAGTLEVAAQVGTSESFARVGYRAEVGGGWRAGATGGVRVDALGFGVTLDATVARSGADPVDLDARLDYRPATGRVGGRVGAQARLAFDAVDTALALGWDLGERDLAAGAVVGWAEGPWSWELDATVGLGYGLGGTGRWRADVALAGAHAFDVVVPEGLVAAAGGRRAGVLEGRVATDAGEALAGVVLRVGRSRAVTDDTGTYRLELVPGRYDVEVDVATVPIAYRIFGATRASVEVGLRATTAFDVPVARTTVLRGRLLEDRDGDGAADEPARPVVARVRVIDADGLGRVVATDAAGGFELRGLAAGAARVEVFDLPLGASVVGETPRAVVLEPGAAADVTVLVRPVPAQVATFGGGALRVRSVVAEVPRVPPGAAPLVRVTLSGAADAVDFVVGAERVPLDADGDGWVGRVPVPRSAVAGVLPFAVEARTGDAVAERREQLIVDPEAPWLEASSDGPVRAGGGLAVAVAAYFDAVSVVVDGAFGRLRLAEDERGRWSGVLDVPVDAPDAVVELAVVAVDRDGATRATTLRFRVLAP